MSTAVIGKDAPPLGIPKSESICQLWPINTTTDIVGAILSLVEPKIEGHDYLNLPDWAFLIKNETSGKQVLFDLGARKDWDKAVPKIAAIPTHLPGYKVTKDVPEILAEANIKLTDISAVLISHWHFDHTGDPALFPNSVDFVVGPGFKDRFLPGYPANEDSPFHAAEFDNRNVIEIEFSDNFKIGKFRAHDYFGDGSLYLLDVPGHTTGHISALVRTTPDSFVFLGGDCCHFTGMIRPSNFLPFPDEIPEGTIVHKAISLPCPCSAVIGCHPDPPNSRTGNNQQPFYKPSTDPISFYDDVPLAIESLKSLAEYDADPNVFVTIAHDPTLLPIFPDFPKATINDWRAKGWKQAAHWGFISELPYKGGKSVVKPLVDGLYLNGKKIRNLDGSDA